MHEGHGQLRCHRAEEDQRLHSEIKRIVSSRHAGDSRDRAVVRANNKETDSPVLALIDKLLPDPTLKAFGEETLAFVVLHDLSTASELDPFVVAEAYGLTPAEAQVAIHLAQGSSPTEISEKRDVSLLTVRSQIKLIREKMGARNQSDLVRQLQELPDLIGR